MIRFVPDLTSDPADQTRAQRILGVLALLALIVLVGLVPQ